MTAASAAVKAACAIPECQKVSRTVGLCDMHYARKLRGRPTGLRAKVGDYQRFASKVALPDENGCMLWLGHRHSDGYGRFALGGSMCTAHRVSLTFAEGPPPESGLVAAHSCRNRHCVAPAHLRWATPKENSADMLIDGTNGAGEKHSSARLTDDDVRAIRDLRATGLTYPQLAAQFQVAPATIGSIVRGERWRHLLGGGA